MEEKIKAAILQALKDLPDLNGCLPDPIIVTIPEGTYYYRVEFDIPNPAIGFAGA